MSLSQMSGREKTIVAILGVIIIAALIGIGLLAARLLVGDGSQEEIGAEGSPGPGPTTEAAGPGATTPPQAGATASITAVAPPQLQPPAATVQAPAGGLSPAPTGGQPAVVAEQASTGLLSPVLIASQPLQPGHQYRIEIRSADGSALAIHGSWGQVSDSARPQVELFEGQTPHTIELLPPEGATQWSCSVSAGPRDLLATSPGLVIQILDVTGAD